MGKSRLQQSCFTVKSSMPENRLRAPKWEFHTPGQQNFISWHGKRVSAASDRHTFRFT